MNELSRAILTGEKRLEQVIPYVKFEFNLSRLNQEMKHHYDSAYRTLYEYVRDHVANGASYTSFQGTQAYYALCKSGIIFDESFVRLSPMGGTDADQSYSVVTDLGNMFCWLKGETKIPVYPGRKGIFHPSTLLRLEKKMPFKEWSISNMHLDTFFRKTEALENLRLLCGHD